MRRSEQHRDDASHTQHEVWQSTWTRQHPRRIYQEPVTLRLEVASNFLFHCMRINVLPKIWRKVIIIAILNLGKDAKVPKSYRPISLLCVPFKILERVILNRITPYVENAYQTFRLPRWKVDHRTSTATVFDHRDGFQLKQKTSVALVDLTVAYDTVWHQGLRLKLPRTIPDKHLVAFIMETLSNRRLVLRSSDGQESRV